MTTIIPKINIDGYTSNEPFVKFKQNYQWTTSNFCLSVENGYTNLNGIIFNGSNGIANNIYINNPDQNMIFGINGNANYIFNINNNEKIRINSNGDIGINNNNPQYKLDINGTLNISSNIYKNNINLDNIYLLIKNNYWLSNFNSIFTDPNSNIVNIGIGNTIPFGTLHIGSPFNSNFDANIVISKLDCNINSRNFKIGYDSNFNFILGDYGDATTTPRIWTPQFYINSRAPSNSLIISSNGNIGINTDNIATYKVNINGSLNATTISGIGSNITNLDYNNVILNKPNLNNLNNWIYDSNSLNLYNNYTLNSKVGIGTTNAGNYKLNVNGSINCGSLFFNGNDINNVFLNNTTAAATYFSIANASYSNAWIKNESTLQVTLNNSIRNYSVGIGTLGNSENVLLNVTGILSAYKLVGNGANITNIAYNNISGVPSFLLASDASNTYYTKNYMDTTYSNTFSSNIANIYGTKNDINILSSNLVQAYNNISPQFITSLASKLSSSNISIFFSNIQQLPFNVNYNLQTFGFGPNTLADQTNSNNIITVGGIITANTIKSIGNIFENNNLLSNIYVSSNNFNNQIIYYDKITDRILSSGTTINYYPPSNSPFNNTYSNIVSTNPSGNGLYIIQSSTNLLTIETNPAYKIFNTTSNINDISWTTADTDEGGRYSLLSYYYNSNTNSNNVTPILLSNNNVENLYGHWIQLYYSEQFILSQIELIINNSSNLPHAPKTITLLASNDFINTSTLNFANTISRNWTKLLDNYIISNYSSNTSNDINNFIISLPTNTIPYNYYRIVISQVQASTFLILNQIKLSGLEFKREWKHSGSNIYSYSNISIGTVNNLSPYNLNVNGLIYSSSNIYAESNIGIGITSPLGNLHIGNSSNISDGTFIISKNNNSNNRNFKFGYDNNFNFTFGDFGNSNNSTSWTPQFYINSNASANSLIIDNNGNIGINTNSTSSYKLFVNGSSYFNGNSNVFYNNIIASNNITILSNLNTSNINTNNFTASNNSTFLSILSTLSNVGIGTTNNFNGTLHIQSLYNTVGLWNVCDYLNSSSNISQFIGKNNLSSNGFYYTYNHIADNNINNYISFNCSQNILAITANNTVGIGTTNPSGVFQIGNGGKLRIGKTDNDYAIFGLLDTDTPNNTKIYLNGSAQNIEYYVNTGLHKFYTANNERLRIDNNGNIGINTTDTTLYKLNINGNIYTSSNIYVNSNIGIGITSPLGNLHIGNSSNISDGTLIISKNDNTNNRNVKIGYDNNFNFVIGDYGNSNVVTWKKQFYINSNAPDTSLIINNNGYIGINNSNPLGYLHIATSSNISDGTLIISKNDNSTNRNFKFGYDNNFNFVIGDYGNSTATAWKKQFYINSNAPDNSLIINTNGNIGIGTATLLSTQKLLVNGDTHILGSLIQSNITSNIFYGTVGIGTTNSQSYNLNIQGTVNISSQLYNSNLLNSNYFIQNGPVKVGSTVNSSTEPTFNFYVNSSICLDGNITLRGGSLSHTGGILTLNSTTVNILNPAYFSSITSINSNVGIGTTTNINNILQIGDGGRLRISNNNTDYSVIGTIDGITSITNTRLIINGSAKTTGGGNIEYYTTGTGNHIFYSGGSNNNELLKIDQNGNVGIGGLNTNYKLNVNGNTNINGELNVINQIKENSSYLSNVYVKLANLSNLSINNINLKKKFGYNFVIGGTSAFTYNGSNYYKYDIQISNLTQFATRTVNSISVNYRVFNIKCFLPDGIFETSVNSIPNVLQYDIYMSSNPLTPTTTPAITPISGLNICAIGIPENYSLSNILPSYISLLRTNNFNYLSVVSANSNLTVAYIIEDYLS